MEQSDETADSKHQASGMQEPPQTADLPSNGHNVKSIDIHSQYFPAGLPDFSTRYGYAGFTSIHATEECVQLKVKGEVVGNLRRSVFGLPERIQDMDSQLISTQILAPHFSLFSYWAKADDTADLCRIVNNRIHKDIQEFGHQRFAALATVPLQAPELAIKELRRCVKRLNCVGVVIGTFVNQWNLDAPELFPFWECCEELDCAVFVQPLGCLPLSMDKTPVKDRQYAFTELHTAIENTTKAVSSMVFGGILEKYKKLKVCFGCGGGTFPYLKGRVNKTFMELSKRQNKTATTLMGATTLSNRFKVDSCVFDEESFEFLVKTLGAERVLFGTSYPLKPLESQGDGKNSSGFAVLPNRISQFQFLSDEEKNLILCGNASSFFGLSG